MICSQRIIWVLNIIPLNLLIVGMIVGTLKPTLTYNLFLILGFILSSAALSMLYLKVKRKYDSHNKRSPVVEGTVDALVAMVEMRDSYTGHHSTNVAHYAYAVAKSMQLSDESCKQIYMGCKLHDLGKVYVPDEILKKPGRLTDEEFKIVKDHPVKGFQVVSRMTAFENTCVPNIVLYHHERVDGTGYPKGLLRDDIPIEARIVAICDAYDAMTTSRSYRKAMSQEAALDIIKGNIGSQFDPDIAEHFFKCIANETLDTIDTYKSNSIYQKTS